MGGRKVMHCIEDNDQVCGEGNIFLPASSTILKYADLTLKPLFYSNFFFWSGSFSNLTFFFSIPNSTQILGGHVSSSTALTLISNNLVNREEPMQ